MLSGTTAIHNHLRTLFISILIISLSPLSPTESAGNEIELDYRLKWLINASVAGDIYADTAGFFQQQGLKVNVKAGGPERDAIRELELGHADFGVASADQVIRALSKGASVVVIAQLFHANPLQWIYRKNEVLLTRLSHLRGKKIGITYGGNDETIMRALLAAGNIKEGEVELFSVRYDYTPFFRRKVDIWPVYRNSQGIFLQNKLEEEGETVGFFNPTDYGVGFVANSVVTTDEMVNNNTEVVHKFTRALLAGWEAAVQPENREKTVSAISRHDRDSSSQSIEQQLLSTSSLVKPNPDHPIGKIVVQDWLQTEEIMVNQQLIDKPVGIEQHLRQFGL